MIKNFLFVSFLFLTQATCCLVQPIGNLIKVWDPNAVNSLLAIWDPAIVPGVTDPFAKNVPVTEIQPTVSQHFVRFYTGSNNKLGSWMMRSQFVRGKTASEIRDLFALPELPTHIVNVEVPEGSQYGLWTGIAGPIFGQGFDWGHGGGQQTRVIFNPAYFPNYVRLPIDAFQHPQPIGEFALSYRPMAGDGNTGRLACYLDQFIPEAYSDMEDVYTALDFLNWVDFGPRPFQEALHQIIPQAYDSIPFVVRRNSILFSNAILDHLTACPASSFVGIGEFGHWNKGFNYKTGGGLVNVEFRATKTLLFGVAGAVFGNDLDWKKHQGSANVTNGILGFYASYCSSIFFTDALVSGGYNWGTAKRHICFHQVDRKAHSKPEGYDFAAHLQGGFSLPCQDWVLTPLARVSYFNVNQNSFKEHKADSLNMKLHNWNMQSLRTYLGAGIGKNFKTSFAQVAPLLQLGWVHYSSIGKNSFKAGLTEFCDSFSIEGIDGNNDAILAELSLRAQCFNGLTAVIEYDIEAGDKWVAQVIELSLIWNY